MKLKINWFKINSKRKNVQAEAESKGLFWAALMALLNIKFLTLKWIVGPPEPTFVNLRSIFCSVWENIHKWETPRWGAIPIKSRILLFFLSFKFIAVYGPRQWRRSWISSFTWGETLETRATILRGTFSSTVSAPVGASSLTWVRVFFYKKRIIEKKAKECFMSNSQSKGEIVEK